MDETTSSVKLLLRSSCWLLQRYMATCRASLDKSGRAGVQKIHLMQPLVEDDNEAGVPQVCKAFLWVRVHTIHGPKMSMKPWIPGLTCRDFAAGICKQRKLFCPFLSGQVISFKLALATRKSRATDSPSVQPPP